MILNGLDFSKIYNSSLQKATKMINNGLYSRFNLSEKERIDKALIGCMGEEAFEQFLIQNNIKYELDSTNFDISNSDEFDFKIADKLIDVKVAKKTTKNNPHDGWTYGYPQEQHPINKDYIIIGWIDFYNKNIGFYGWTNGSKISQYRVVTENSYAGYKYLTPNHEFKWGILNKDFSQLFNEIFIGKK